MTQRQHSQPYPPLQITIPHARLTPTPCRRGRITRPGICVPTEARYVYRTSGVRRISDPVEFCPGRSISVDVSFISEIAECVGDAADGQEYDIALGQGQR